MVLLNKRWPPGKKSWSRTYHWNEQRAGSDRCRMLGNLLSGLRSETNL